MDTPSVTFFIIGIVGMILIAVGTALSFVLYSKQYFSVGFTINESSLRLLGLLNILDFGASVLLGIGIVFGGLAFFGLWRSYRSRLALGAAIFSFISAPWPLPPRLLEVLGLSWNVVPSYSGYSLEPGPFYPLSVILSIVKICLVGVAFALWSVTAVANSFRAEHQLIMLTAGVLLAIASVEIISGLTGASYLLLGFPSYYYLIGYTPGQWLFPAVLLFSVALRYAHTGN